MKFNFLFSKQPIEVDAQLGAHDLEVTFLKKHFQGHLLRWAPPEFAIETKDGVTQGMVYRGKDFIDVHTPQGTYRLVIPPAARRGTHHHAPGSLSSPMPGKVLRVLVKAGQKVEAGETLIVMEAMKMEHKIVAPDAGQVEQVFFKEGDRVGQDVDLLKMGS